MQSARAWIAQACIAAGLLCAVPAGAQTGCNKRLYLTFDTGHMGVAPLIADQPCTFLSSGLVKSQAAKQL